MASRLRLKPLGARFLLAVLAVLVAYGAFASFASPASGELAVVDRTDTDLALYKAVASRVGAGETYYEAAVSEHRRRRYPLRPAVTLRLPALAWMVAATGERTASILLHLLALGAIAGLTVRLKAVAGPKPLWAAATFLVAASTALLTVPVMTYWHESWSALLIALSLAIRTEKRWIASVVLGVLAVLVRELAFPYLCVMGLLAWKERNHVEAAAWASAGLLFLALLAAHAAALSALATDADLASPGWSSGGGWPFVLAMLHRVTLLAMLPPPFVALLVPLALLGWAGMPGGFSSRGALLLLGYVGAFMLFGRPDNFYWGIMIAPLLPLGLAFAPRALADLARAARSASATSPAPV